MSDDTTTDRQSMGIDPYERNWIRFSILLLVAFAATITVGGDAGTIEVANTMSGSIAIGGDLDSIDAGWNLAGSVTAEAVLGSFELHDRDVVIARDYDAPTRISYVGDVFTEDAGAPAPPPPPAPAPPPQETTCSPPSSRAPHRPPSPPLPRAVPLAPRKRARTTAALC